MAPLGEAVYCTLLMTDHYLPGAVVLAHSLRDNGTKARLVALFTPETLKESTVKELQSVYDEIIPVRLFTNGTPANLFLMNRPDLISTFTKIELWRQTQFSKIVYIDADVVAIKAPDELLALEEDFAAAPDIGWPDIFNSGVMVLRPNHQDYHSLRALAERGISFDGGDQGLFNTHFKKWHRLSFIYNCTPSGNYQYMPAYRHFESTISLVHFIGAQKPWTQSRHAFAGGTPYYQLLGRWWAVYDRHYHPQPPPFPISKHYESENYQLPGDLSLLQRSPVSEAFLESVHHSAPDLIHPKPVHPQSVFHGVQISHIPQETQTTEARSVVPLYVQGEEHQSVFVHSASDQHDPIPKLEVQLSRPERRDESQYQHQQQPEPEPSPPQHQNPPALPPPEERPFSPPRSEWDASRDPPPLHSRPEASYLQTQIYNMSDDMKLFQPPPSYPEAPKNMYYEVPTTKPKPQKLAQIFPWEARASKPTRVFAEDSTVTSAEPSLGETDDTSQHSVRTSSESVQPHPHDLWQSWSRSNAWDEDPEIERYVEAIQRPKKGDGRPGTSPGAGSRKASLRITDFPTEIDRPSLPVTPAPVRKSFWGRDPDEAGELPAAEGVPSQEDWNPMARLEELHRRQSELFETPTVLLHEPSEWSDKTDQV